MWVPRERAKEQRDFGAVVLETCGRDLRGTSKTSRHSKIQMGRRVGPVTGITGTSHPTFANNRVSRIDGWNCWCICRSA